MREILIITHGNLAIEILAVAESILEKKTRAKAVCCDLGLTPEQYKTKIEDTLNSLVANEQVIILTDMFGGSPSNLSIPFIKKDQLEVITGLNLAMLLYILSEDERTSFQDLCKGTKKAGEEAIVIAGEFLI
ncbi:MAG: PTS sugar transporter subunit IIA [Deltaproteobacteria bacterium]|nr:PTS sugar transporter subunit IIA [Deltaproteobacteria bacterium]